MLRAKRNILCCFLVVYVSAALLSSSLVVGAPAKTPAAKGSLNQRLNNVNGKIKTKQSELRQIKTQQKNVMGQLASTQKKLQNVQSDLNQNKLKLMQAQSDLTAIAKRLDITQKRLDRRTKLLAIRLADIYKGEDIEYVDVLLGSRDMRTFLSRGHYVRNIVTSDVNLINEIKKDKAQIEADKKQQMSKVRQISQLQAQLISQRDSVEDLKNQKQAELNAIEHDRALYERALAGLVAESSRIENEIRRIQMTPKGQKRAARTFAGNLSMPVSGRITSTFGYRVHPITKVRSLHTGVDIACPTGTPIRAAADGEVILAGWMGAYGNTVVIDHGGGVSTLYGHNSSLTVKAGQQVKRGQTIAKAGSTGWSTGPHCHFEKRINGRPVNPM